MFVAVILLPAILFTLSQKSEGMIRTLTLSELIVKAECIVVAEVCGITKTGDIPERKLTLLRNELKVIESLKGSLQPSESIVMNTIRGEHWLEDNVQLPLPGSRVFLFLRKNQKGDWAPVNGIQGVWPMKGNELSGMGTGKDLNELRRMIKQSR